MKPASWAHSSTPLAFRTTLGYGGDSSDEMERNNMISQAQKQYQAILAIATRINPRLNRADLEAILGAIGIESSVASDAVGGAIRAGILVWENQGYAPGQGLKQKRSH